MKILDYTAVGLAKAIRNGEVTSPEAVQAVLTQIKEREESLHCYVTIDEEGALRKAQEVQKKIEAGELTGPLAGVPVAIKDNMCTEGMLTTCSSKILGNFIPTFSSEAVLNLEKAGAVILGKTNMAQRKIPGMKPMYREDPPVDRQQPLLLRNASLHLAPIPVAPYVSRLPTVAWLE